MGFRGWAWGYSRSVHWSSTDGKAGERTRSGRSRGGGFRLGGAGRPRRRYGTDSNDVTAGNYGNVGELSTAGIAGTASNAGGSGSGGGGGG